MAYVLLAFAIVFEVTATTSLKLSDGFTRVVPSAVTVLGYGVSFYLLSICLKTLNVGFVYAVWAGAGIALIALIGVVALGERVDGPGLLGLGLIIAGIVVLNVFSRMGHA